MHVFASKAVRDLPTPHPQSQDYHIHVCIFYFTQIYKDDIVDAKILVLHIFRAARKSSLSLSQRLSDFLDEYEANVVVPSSTTPLKHQRVSGGLDSRMVQARQCFIGLFRPQAHFNRGARTPETERSLGLCLMRHQQALWMPSNIPWNRVTNLEIFGD